MATIYEIRRDNLRILVRERGNGEVSKAIGYSSASYLSQMVCPKASRPVTELTARKVEKALTLPVYWLDQERDLYGDPVGEIVRPQKQAPPVDNIVASMVDHDQFTNCAYTVTDTATSAGVKLPREKFKAIVKLLMEHREQDEESLKSLAETLVKLSV